MMSATVTINSRLNRMLRTPFMQRLVFAAIALHLAVLAPLICVIHCAIHDVRPDHPAIEWFLCGDHETLHSAGSSAPEASLTWLRVVYDLVITAAIGIGFQRIIQFSVAAAVTFPPLLCRAPDYPPPR